MAAIVVEFNLPGMTVEQYDRVIADLEKAGSGAPDGRSFHVAAASGVRRIFLPLAASLLFSLAPPMSPLSAEEPGSEPDRSFRIHILDCDWPSTLDGYTTEEVWPQLEKCMTKPALFVVETTDVDSYCWDLHYIELTPQASSRLRAALGDEWVRFGGSNQGFVATLGEERLYGGTFYEEFGAAAIQFPVIHLDRLEDRLGFRLRDGLVYRGSGTERIAVAAVKEYFASLDKLRCGPPEASDSFDPELSKP
jgi:hypothetical protein